MYDYYGIIDINVGTICDKNQIYIYIESFHGIIYLSLNTHAYLNKRYHDIF